MLKGGATSTLCMIVQGPTGAAPGSRVSGLTIAAIDTSVGETSASAADGGAFFFRRGDGAVTHFLPTLTEADQGIYEVGGFPAAAVANGTELAFGLYFVADYEVSDPLRQVWDFVTADADGHFPADLVKVKGQAALGELLEHVLAVNSTGVVIDTEGGAAADPTATEFEIEAVGLPQAQNALRNGILRFRSGNLIGVIAEVLEYTSIPGTDRVRIKVRQKDDEDVDQPLPAAPTVGSVVLA